MCRAPCSTIWQWEKNNREGRVPTTKTFTLIYCFFLSASIATWFQTHEHQNEILNFKNFFYFSGLFQTSLSPHFLMNKAQQSQWLLKDIYMYKVFETGTWTKRGRETSGQNHCSGWRERHREFILLRDCIRHSVGHKETNDPDNNHLMLLTADSPKSSTSSCQISARFLLSRVTQGAPWSAKVPFMP